jgi:hypothetical protein
MSMHEAVIKALSNGPVAREHLVRAVEDVGFRFKTKNPINSIGVVLYAKNTPVKKNKDGKYYVEGGGGATAGNGFQASEPTPARRKRRRMSAEGRARIAAAARARWARAKAGK